MSSVWNLEGYMENTSYINLCIFWWLLIKEVFLKHQFTNIYFDWIVDINKHFECYAGYPIIVGCHHDKHYIPENEM